MILKRGKERIPRDTDGVYAVILTGLTVIFEGGNTGDREAD